MLLAAPGRPIGKFVQRKEYSRIAQLAEHSTVNRMVPGSSPGAGALFLSRNFIDSKKWISKKSHILNGNFTSRVLLEVFL